MSKMIGVLAVVVLATAAFADPLTGTFGPGATPVEIGRDTIGVPYDGIQTYGSAAQNFAPPYDAYDIQPFMNFTTTVDYYLNETFCEGFATVAADGPAGAGFEVWDGLPWEDGAIVLSTTGTDTLYSTGTIDGDFGGAELAAGSYYFSAYSNRDYATHGQSFLYQTSLGDNNDWHWNPGGGFGMGEYWQLTDQSGNPIDLNFIIYAEVVPEPASLLLFGLAGLLLRRR
jgi:hypothetical protein